MTSRNNEHYIIMCDKTLINVHDGIFSWIHPLLSQNAIIGDIQTIDAHTAMVSLPVLRRAILYNIGSQHVEINGTPRSEKVWFCHFKKYL